MIEFIQPNNKCWWCGADADSTEHRIKKSDLVSEFGRGPYKGNDAVVRGYLKNLRNVMGPKSKELKFDKNICQKCNNYRSKPFDLAYQEFTKYLKEHETTIIKTRILCFPDIFGKDWKQERDNLLRYYTKHICCRLSSINLKIEDEIIGYLEGRCKMKYLQFFSDIRLDIVAMIIGLKKNNIGNGCLWTGDLLYKKNDKRKIASHAHSFLGYRWFRMNWVYDSSIQSPDQNSENLDKIEIECAYNVNPIDVLNL